MPSGLTKSLKLLYLSLIPLGKDIFGISFSLQNSVILALGIKQYSFILFSY